MQQRRFQRVRHAPQPLRVDRAGAFAQAQAVAEDLSPAGAGRVDEAAQAVKTKESGLLLRIRVVARDRAGAAVDE